WHSGLGAVTWADETGGLTGSVSDTNSFVGGGRSSISPFSNGNYLICNPAWGNNQGIGAWAPGNTGISGMASDANSLVVTHASDWVGSDWGGIFRQILILANGNYLVGSPRWNGERGALTWGSGTSGAAAWDCGERRGVSPTWGLRRAGWVSAGEMNEMN